MTAATRQGYVQFVYAQTAWMLGALVVLVLLGAFDLELYYVVSLIGLLIVVELTASVAATPPWRRRLRWIVGAGLVGFAYVVVRRILEILPEGVL